MSSEKIDSYIAGLTDWRGPKLTQLRQLIRQAVPELTEDWKWDVPVWTLKGNVLAAGAFKDHIKLNFFKGAAVPDSQKLFNAGLEAKATRAIDFHEADAIPEAALQALVAAAAALNRSK